MNETLRLTRLYSQELRALPRARFSLAGLALLAAALTAFAVVVIPSPLGLWNFALVVYGAGPVLIGALAAIRIAGLRADHTTQSLYTMPVRSRTVFGAHLLVCLTLAASYLVATLPFLGVTAWHIGVPSDVLLLLLGGGVLLVFAVILGTLLGVFFTGRSVAAPVGLTTAFLFLAMMSIPPNASLQLDGAMEGSFVMRMLHLSPYVLVSDGLGLLEPSVGAAARSPLLALSLVAVQIATMFVVALWVFTREQGPEQWETGPVRKMSFVAVTLLVLLAMPLAVADAGYMPLEGKDAGRYGSSSRTDGAAVTLVRSGTAVAEADFRDHRAGTSKAPLDATGPNERDLLILLPLADPGDLRDLMIDLQSDRYLRVEPEHLFLQRVADPEHDPRGTVLRVPVILTPMDPQDLSSNVYQLWTNVTYSVLGEDGDRHGSALSAVEAAVPWAHTQLAAAGLPLTLAATVGAIGRRLRVG